MEKKRTKTFKIGEYAIGGIVKVTLTGAQALVQCLSWGTKQVVQEHTTSVFDLEMYLECEVTSCYYAGKIMDWVNKG